MDKMILIDDLKRKNEILPYEFDGTYRSVHETFEFYARLRKISLIDHSDLELIYYLSLGIWKNEKTGNLTTVPGTSDRMRREYGTEA